MWQISDIREYSVTLSGPMRKGLPTFIFWLSHSVKSLKLGNFNCRNGIRIHTIKHRSNTIIQFTYRYTLRLVPVEHIWAHHCIFWLWMEETYVESRCYIFWRSLWLKSRVSDSLQILTMFRWNPLLNHAISLISSVGLTWGVWLHWCLEGLPWWVTVSHLAYLYL